MVWGLPTLGNRHMFGDSLRLIMLHIHITSNCLHKKKKTMGFFIPMVVVFQYLGLFSGKFTYGKSPFLMGKSTLPSGKRLHHEKSNFFSER